VDLFVARQPILDRSGHTYAYEVLVGPAPGGDGPPPTALETPFLLFGVEAITGGTAAFISCSRETLLATDMASLPRGSIALEIAPTADPDDAVRDACRLARMTGHLIAVDHARADALIDVADIVTVDFATTADEARATLVPQYRPRTVRLLARNVETYEEFDRAKAAGYDYFHGHFFSKPIILAGRDIAPFKLHLLDLIRAINQPDLELEQIESLIKREVSLTLKLLNYMNLTKFGLRRPVSSIRQALMLLGESGVRRWASVVALAGVGRDKPFELVVSSVVRAKLCEQLCEEAGMEDGAPDGFLLGLFSMIDVLVGRPLAAVLQTLPVADDVREALLGNDSPLRPIYDLAIAYEQGDWSEVSCRAPKLGLEPRRVADMYVSAVGWGSATTTLAD
jgi:EAL and modified HD-GYP domain-containing signal transduction protein